MFLARASIKRVFGCKYYNLRVEVYADTWETFFAKINSWHKRSKHFKERKHTREVELGVWTYENKSKRVYFYYR